MKIRFAILGFGHHATRRLVPAFAQSSETTLVGLWRRNPEAGQADARLHGIHAFATAAELCASPDVDAVFITSPDAMHLEDCRVAFAHKKAVLCEKPLAMNGGQAQEILDLSKQSPAQFGVGQNFRYNRSLESMREQVVAGRIGTPQLAHAQYSYLGTSAPRKWITDPELACGGPIADVGIHCLDSLRFVLDDEFRSVNVLASKDAASGEVEAIATMQLQTVRGAFANVTATARAPYRSLIEITGSEGVLIAENALTVDRPVEVELRRAGERVESVTLSNNDGYVRMIDAFARACRGEGSFACTGEDAVINQRLLDAAYRSWHSGLRETL